MNILTHAYALAGELHEGQVRKSVGTPLLAHLTRVAGTVQGWGGTNTEVAAAFLHDAAEDAGGEPTIERIAHELSPEIAGFVRECSDSITPLKSDKDPWHARRDAYLASIPTKSTGACLISLADKLDNLTGHLIAYPWSEEFWKPFKGGKDDTIAHYIRLCDAFTKRSKDEPRLAPAIAHYHKLVEQLQALS